MGLKRSAQLTLPGERSFTSVPGLSLRRSFFVVGKRVCCGKYSLEPNNIPLTILGAPFLWLGCVGLNTASALCANGLATQA
ncbi:MAG: hypothetical protein WCF90_00105 [Methanomicrobiales archaeon]